jgi:hypothetical protein
VKAMPSERNHDSGERPDRLDPSVTEARRMG